MQHNCRLHLVVMSNFILVSAVAVGRCLLSSEHHQQQQQGLGFK